MFRRVKARPWSRPASSAPCERSAVPGTQKTPYAMPARVTRTRAVQRSSAHGRTSDAAIDATQARSDRDEEAVPVGPAPEERVGDRFDPGRNQEGDADA